MIYDNDDECIKTYTSTACGEAKTESVPKVSNSNGDTQNPPTQNPPATTPSTEQTVTEQLETTSNQPSVGDTVVLTSGNYKIIKSDSTAKEVTYIKPKNSKTLKSVTIGKNAIKGIKAKTTIKCPKKQLSKYKKLFNSKTGYKRTMKIKK